MTTTPPPHKPEEKQEEQSSEMSNVSADLPSLRTYKADVAHAMQDEKTSLVKIVLEEQRAKFKRREENSPKATKNLVLISVSVLLSIATIGLVYYAFIRKNLTEDEITLNTLNVRPIIFVEKNREIVVDTSFEAAAREKIRNHIANDKLTLDTIEYVFFTEEISVETEEGIIKQKTVVAPDKFFGFIDLSMPGILHRALGEDYMFGIHYFNDNSPFFVLTTQYYDNMFAGVLEWERRLSEEMLALWGQSAKGKELRNRRFEDLVIKNNDTRALRDFDGKIALVYMFKDEKTLIITTNEDTLLEVSRRLDLSRGRK
ncbi:hypothetical protein L0Y69_02920 [bacterium]|nr:hypothetical protein [bacterium]